MGVGFVTGTPWVGIFHTVPVPANTAPVTGMGTYRTRICAVSHETRGILIIKIIEIIIAITITITLQYLKRTGGGREYETAALSKKTK